MIITTVPMFHAMTVWAVALDSQFGWSRTQLGFALSLTRVEGSISGPIAGYLTDRFGARLLVFSGLMIMAAGFFLFSQVQNLWMFYLAFLVISMGQGQAGWLPVMTLLNQWFIRRRSAAMAIAMTGMGLGALILVPAIAWAVNPDQGLDRWRWTAGALGVVILVSAFLIPRLIRNRPQDYNQLPDGEQPDPESRAQQPQQRSRPHTLRLSQSPPDFTTAQALRTPAFWCISLGHGFASMVILAIMTHVGLLLVNDEGFSVQTAAWIVAVYTAVSLLFQLIGGYLGDRVAKNVVLFVFTSIQAGAVVLLTFSSSLLGYYLFAVLFGIGFGGRTPLTTSIRGDYFGRASYGKILGVSTVPMNVLLFISSPLAGYLRDSKGSYDEAFITLAILNFVGAILFLMARRPRLPSPVSQPQPV